MASPGQICEHLLLNQDLGGRRCPNEGLIAPCWPERTVLGASLTASSRRWELVRPGLLCWRVPLWVGAQLGAAVGELPGSLGDGGGGSGTCSPQEGEPW